MFLRKCFSQVSTRSFRHLHTTSSFATRFATHSLHTNSTGTRFLHTSGYHLEEEKVPQKKEKKPMEEWQEYKDKKSPTGFVYINLETQERTYEQPEWYLPVESIEAWSVIHISHTTHTFSHTHIHTHLLTLCLSRPLSVSLSLCLSFGLLVILFPLTIYAFSPKFPSPYHILVGIVFAISLTLCLSIHSYLGICAV